MYIYIYVCVYMNRAPQHVCANIWNFSLILGTGSLKTRREREKFITRQPPKWGKDNYNSANSWISGGLPGSGRREERRWFEWILFLWKTRRRGEGLNGSSSCRTLKVTFKVRTRPKESAPGGRGFFRSEWRLRLW